jgi:hypothetical protein
LPSRSVGESKADIKEGQASSRLPKIDIRYRNKDIYPGAIGYDEEEIKTA